MKAFLDTNIYISHYRYGLYEDLLHRINAEHFLHLHAVVLAELYAGVKSRAFLKELLRLEKLFSAKDRIIVPQKSDYILAGHILNRFKNRELFADALLSASARSQGMLLISEDKDFEEIRRIKSFSFQWVPRPVQSRVRTPRQALDP